MGKELIITDEVYNSWIKKWNVKNLKKVSSLDWTIRGQCPYCNDPCFSCLLRKLFGGCSIIIGFISNGNNPDTWFTDSCHWITKKKAIACVSKIEAELKKFEEII